MRLIGRRPFRHRPESIHQPSRTIGKLVGKPPLCGKRSMRTKRKPLKVSYPVIRTECRIAIGDVTGLRVIKRFNSSEPCRVAVTALVGQVTTEFNAIALLGSYGCPVNDVLGPLGRGFD